MENEIPANLAFLERLGGDPATVEGRGTMLPTTYAYTRHLLSTCALGDCADGLTAVLPCQWSYGELARPLTAHPPADPIYADWIALFGNDEYDGLVGDSTALLDRLVDPDDAPGWRRSRRSSSVPRTTKQRSGTWPTGTPERPVSPTKEEPIRCVPCGSTTTSRSGWTTSTT